jgi:hypothetical protein
MVPKAKVDLIAATQNALVSWLRKHVTRWDRTRVNVVSPGLCGSQSCELHEPRWLADTAQMMFLADLRQLCLKSTPVMLLI